VKKAEREPSARVRGTGRPAGSFDRSVARMVTATPWRALSRQARRTAPRC